MQAPDQDPDSPTSAEALWSPPWVESRRLAMEALERGRWREAEMAIGESLVLAPRRELPELYGLRAFIRLRTRRAAEAIDDADACLSEMPDHREVQGWRGMARAMLGQWDAAIEDLESVARGARDSRVSGQWLERTVAEAIFAWKQEARQQAPSADDFVRRARWYLAVGDIQRSARDLSEAQRGDATASAMLKVSGALALDQGQIDEAWKAIQARVRVTPQDPQAWRDLAEIAMRIGEPRRGRDAAERYQRRMGTSFSDRWNVAMLWRRVGDRLRALSICDDLVSRGETSPSLSLLRGELYMELRCWNSAAETWRERLVYRPYSIEDRLQLGRCLMKMRRFDEATSEFDEAIRIAPTHPEAHAGLGQARWSLRDISGARAAIEKALRLDTMHLPSRVIAAHLDLGVGRIEAASQLLEAAWARDSKDSRADTDWIAECAFVAGVAALEKGQPEVALRWLDAAIERRPDHPGSWVWRAKVWAKQGRLDRCRRDLVCAVRLHPSCESQYRKLGRDLAKERVTLARLESGEGDITRLAERAIAWEMAGSWDELQSALPALSHALRGSNTGLSSSWRWEVRLLEIRQLARSAPERLSSALCEVLEKANSWERVASLLDDFEPSRWDDASAEALERLCRRFPDQGRLAHHLGAIQFGRRRWRKAAKWMSLALASGYIEAETLAICGAAKGKRGERNAAIRLLSLALERHPNEPRWLAWRGDVRLRCRAFEEAAADFELALTLDPKQVSAHAGLGMVIARRGDWEESVRWITQAFHRFSSPQELATLLRCRARVYFNMRRYRRAIEDWDAAASDTGDDRELADLYFARAVAFFHLGEMQSMRLDLERCLLLRSSHRNAKAVLDWLDNRTERFPVPLTPPGRTIAATRPSIAHEGWEMREWAGGEPRFPFNQWMVRKSSGKEFGPVAEGMLREWIREGRVATEDWLLRSDWNRWRRAVVISRTSSASDSSRSASRSDSQEIRLSDVKSPRTVRPRSEAERGQRSVAGEEPPATVDTKELES